ncbi:MAG: 3-dehydroquinate synthase [bacterium]
MSENIILIGFMGAGKDTIGRYLAQRLRKSFISTDTMIELAEGQTVAEIFEKKGEAYFRKKEAWVLQKIQYLRNTIIATGGGIVLSENNRALLQKMGKVVHLHAEISTLKKRLRFDGSRPLIKSMKDLKILYNNRRKNYDFAEVEIDTTKKSIEAVVHEVIKKLKLSAIDGFDKLAKVMVKTQTGCHRVIVGADIMQNFSIKSEEPTKVLVITNPLVGALYLNELKNGLEKNGYEIYVKIMPDGERYKTLKVVSGIYELLLRHNFSRADVVIGLGGGVITDIAGFVASTYKRGMRFINIPTTLLGQVDAGIGGKNGLNTRSGKNMIGTFYQPEMVICDIKTILSLSDDELKNGISEVIKYGLIRSEKLCNILKSQRTQIMERRLHMLYHIVKECVSIKASIITQDEKETKGSREILNFGHTVGHIIETLTKYKYSHGEAIAIGMVEEMQRFGMKSNRNKNFLVDLLKQYGLPFRLPDKVKNTDITALLIQDKKVRANTIKISVIERPGKAIIKNVHLGG